jgi:hypothetical protein
MKQNLHDFPKGGRRRRRRSRMAACLSGSRGKVLGISSLAAPIAGYIVNDLRKPDSIIRNLVAVAVSRVRLSSIGVKKELDIGDRAEIVVHEDKNGV